MIPVSASDILKILESIPGWKAVMGLPKRLAELEARVAALEKGDTTRSGPKATDCPQCGATLVFASETDHPDFGFAGMKVHTLRCDACGFTTTKTWDQKRGYG